MAIGPAMIMGGLGILALMTMGKKSSASSAPQLPSGEPGSAPQLPGPSSSVPGFSPTKQQPVNTTGFQRVDGPVPVLLPPELAELMAKALKDMTVTDSGSVLGPVSPESIQRATTVAAQIEKAGFVDAANALRAFIQAAARKVPSPAPDKQVKLPGVSPLVVEQVNRAVQLERDPNKLRAILISLNSLPRSTERDMLIEMLSNTIKQVEAAIVMAETLKQTQKVLDNPGPPPASTKPTPVSQEIVVPEVIVTAPAPRPAPIPTAPPRPAGPEVADTVEARRALNLSNHMRNLVVDAGGDVKKAKGREDKGMVKAFQLAEGATAAQADGLAGPNTNLKLAKYLGDIPLVFYWPKSATATNVNSYRATLRQMADVHEQAGRPVIAAQLRSAATRERGQAGIVGTMPA